MTLIRLDLDNISYTTLLKIIDKIKKYPNSKEIKISESCKMSGYHIEIETFWKMKAQAVYHMRYYWGDDTKRLVRDVLGIGDNLLFNFKLETKGIHRHLWEKTPMLLYYRETNESEWQLKQEKSSQTCTLEPLEESLP